MTLKDFDLEHGLFEAVRFDRGLPLSTIPPLSHKAAKLDLQYLWASANYSSFCPASHPRVRLSK